MLVVLAAGALQVVAALIYSWVRAKDPWSLSIIGWTCVLQVCGCMRGGTNENPLVSSDRHPAKYVRPWFVYGSSVSNRLVAVVYWCSTGVLAVVCKPLAVAAESAYRDRQPMQPDAIQRVLILGTMWCCVAVLLPLLLELLPHPNRLDQTVQQLADAEHTYWPMTGRRRL